jgi:hypothetical protein
MRFSTRAVNMRTFSRHMCCIACPNTREKAAELGEVIIKGVSMHSHVIAVGLRAQG